MNKLFAILISCFLMFPALAIEQETGIAPQNTAALETISQEDATALNENGLREEIEDIQESAMPSPYKEPVSKKSLIKKLLMAMLCVGASSVFIYAVLSIYNKIRTKIYYDTEVPAPQENEKPLKAPMDLIDAIKSFIEHTNW